MTIKHNVMSRAEIAELGKRVKTLSSEEQLALAEEHQKAAVLKRLNAPKSMLNHRIRQLKKAGYSNVAIGTVLDIHESTVRRRLKMPLEPIEILLDKMLFNLEDAREDILGKLVDHPELEKVFGEGYGENYILRIHTNSRKAEIDPKRRRVKFTLEFVATAV